MKSENKMEKVFVPAKDTDHQDPMRSMTAETHNRPYRSYATLAETISASGIVILQGDDGGQIYMTCPAANVKCSEAGLQKLLQFLDDLSWKDIASARIFFEDTPQSLAVPGGMGGGLVTGDIWLHPRLQAHGIEDRVRSFVQGVIEEL